MRAPLLLFCLLGFLVCPLPGQSDQGLTLDKLLNEKELRKYNQKVKYKDRMEVFADAVKRFSKELRELIEKKKVDQIVSTLNRLEALAQYAINEPLPANKKDRKAGEVRKFEIELRKLLSDIRDAKTIAPYEYHAEFDHTIQELARLRGELLRNFFGSALEQESTNSRAPEPETHIHQQTPIIQGFAPPMLRVWQGETRYSYEITGDQFTDQEYEKIQNNQELKKRVDAFLEIAEARLVEIKRRMNNQEWTEKDPNPLEFYTLEQMVHAYRRALDSLMVNIDEQVKYKLAKEKDVKKSLEKLNKKIMEFTPQLEPIKQLAIKNKDEILYKEVLEAEKTSEIARKGSQYGLGAPAK
ncbi:MAG TPA: hypothetical protein PLP42_03630 [Acidobacteriota bacterium]|nr:hypothetical protein [Acidobacteriota bacterium]